MRILELEQGTPEWHQARLGIPTASQFKNIYTATKKASTSAATYRYTLIGDKLLGTAEETFETEWMRRGTELEDEARETYEFIHNVTVERVGFVLGDEGKVGCSPDGLVGDGGLEIKCPKRSTHVKYLLAGKIPGEYVPQVQGCMWICEREHWDFMSYYPGLEPLITRVARDDEYIEGLKTELTTFLTKLENDYAKLKGRR